LLAEGAYLNQLILASVLPCAEVGDTAKPTRASAVHQLRSRHTVYLLPGERLVVATVMPPARIPECDRAHGLDELLMCELARAHDRALIQASSLNASKFARLRSLNALRVIHSGW